MYNFIFCTLELTCFPSSSTRSLLHLPLSQRNQMLIELISPSGTVSTLHTPHLDGKLPSMVIYEVLQCIRLRSHTSGLDKDRGEEQGREGGEGQNRIESHREGQRRIEKDREGQRRIERDGEEEKDRQSIDYGFEQENASEGDSSIHFFSFILSLFSCSFSLHSIVLFFFNSNCFFVYLFIIIIILILYYCYFLLFIYI